MENNDVVKDAIAKAAAKAAAAGHALPSAVREALAAKSEVVPKVEVHPKLKLDSRSEVLPEPEVIKERKEPIWPMDDEQLAQWKKDMAEMKVRAKLPKKEEPLTPERRAEIHKMATEAAHRLASSRRSVTKIKPVAEPKERAIKEKKAGRQQRLGQTKLIDDLLKAGKNEKEIFDTVREKIPSYPADKLPKLIKLRQYHVKK